MNSNYEKKQVSSGRARGHSMWSTLRATSQEQIPGGYELQGGHAGISSSRLRESLDPGQPSQELSNAIPGRGRIVSESRVSLLTTALQAVGSGLPTSAPIEIQQPAAASESDEEVHDYYDREEETLRKWCTGHPPKKSFLGSDGRLPTCMRFTRRSTLADKPELDAMLAMTKTEYNGHMYLPLTAHTIHKLSPYWKGSKPIADTKLFEYIKITQDINGVHADHVVAALERIGSHCNHLLVISGVQTSELGNVFNREAGNITPANDWDLILGCFPHLKHLMYIHPVDEPDHLSRRTMLSLHRAIIKRQAAQQLERFSYDAPAKLIAWLHQDMAAEYAQNNI